MAVIQALSSAMQGERKDCKSNELKRNESEREVGKEEPHNFEVYNKLVQKRIPEFGKFW